MKLIHDTAELNNVDRKIIATIGNFDGVHIGHKFLLKQIISQKKSDESLLVITYNPHPEFVINQQDHYLICSYLQKYEYLKQEGVDFILEVKFNSLIRNLDPVQFFNQFVLGIKNLTHFYFGEDFSLGKNRCFKIDDAVELLRQKNIGFSTLNKIKNSQQTISSTMIRQLIDQCQFGKVSELLGRKYQFESNVISGKRVGRQIGIQTANLELDPDLKYPPQGVYAVKVKYDNKFYAGAMNIGLNPTVSRDNKIKAEVHIIDFDDDIYGQRITVIPVLKIRDEIKFDSLQELAHQIQIDISKVKQAIAHD